MNKAIFKRRIYKQWARSIIVLCVVLIITLVYLYNFLKIYDYEQSEKEQIDLIISQYVNEDVDNVMDHIISNSDKAIILPESSTETSNETEQKIQEKSDTRKDVKWLGDCILEIPDIDLKKIVYTGEEREKHLENYELITAASDMYYKSGGNYIICGHASRLYGHSLNRLKEIKKGMDIYIQTKEQKDHYIVKKVSYQSMNETSNYCKQSDQKVITIISCAKYISEHSYIVIEAELE